MNGGFWSASEVEKHVDFGQGCLIATNTWGSTSDLHCLLNLEDGRRINPAADIQIDDACWICLGAVLLPGSRLAANSIIAAGTISRGIAHLQNLADFESQGCHSLVMGASSKVVKPGIDWFPGFIWDDDDRLISVEPEAAAVSHFHRGHWFRRRSDSARGNRSESNDWIHRAMQEYQAAIQIAPSFQYAHDCLKDLQHRVRPSSRI